MILAFYLDLPKQYRRYVPRGCSAKIHGGYLVKFVEIIPPKNRRRKVGPTVCLYKHSPGNAARKAGAAMRVRLGIGAQTGGRRS